MKGIAIIRLSEYSRAILKAAESYDPELFLPAAAAAPHMLSLRQSIQQGRHPYAYIYIVRYVYMYINAYYVCVYIAIYIYRQSRTPILFKGNLCTRLVDDSNSICVNSNVSLCLTIPFFHYAF